MDLQKIKKSFQRRINSTLGGINSGSNEVGLYPEDEPEAIESSSTTQVQLPGKAQTRSLPVNNPTHEKEILDRIEAVYYSTDDFDAGEYELKKLAEVLDSNDINTERRKLREQLSVVSKKVSTLILENHPSYAAELQKVTEVQRMLSDTFDLCKRARSNLKEAQYMTSGAGLKLLANHKKMQLLRRLMTALRTIKTLHETDYHLRDLLQEGNFPAAIQLCFEGRKATETYSHFSCIGELSCKLSDTLVRIEEQLDDALASVTLHFDPDRYAHLNTGYTLLSKVPDAALKLIAYFRATLENSARTVLVDYVSARKVDNKFESLSYEELCKEVDGAVESDSDDSDEELEAVKQDYVDETGVEQKYVSKLNVLKPSESMPPVLCNTALNLLRFFGRYLHMTYMLRSVANDAIVGLTELFDYYLYSVCAFFCSDATNFGVSLCGARLSAALRRIESTLIVSSRNSPSKSNGRLPACRISPVVQFNYPDRLFGLAERVVGVESLVFIGEQVHALRPVMQSLLSQAKLPFLQQFFAQTVSGVAEVRRAAYGAVATRALNYDHLLAQVTATKWDIGELRSQHSAYVDFLLHDLANFAQRLAAVAEATPLCREAHDILWDVVILCANKTLIQGFELTCVNSHPLDGDE
uniref:Vacuolar protein sorting-associated protein 54 n=1 Tax=Plectus sambesii TaxID=2011161 RepID=A0A914VNQ4_9BILA